MKRLLIVNADDFNLTEGISRAILCAHQKGIVSSTSVFTNLPFPSLEFRALRTLKSLGIGLHLNATFGKPLSGLKEVSSLLDQKGYFKHPDRFSHGEFSDRELKKEFKLQLLRFQVLFERMPDHLNTHHHLHRNPRIFDVVSNLSERYQIPLRRVPIRKEKQKVMMTDYFFGNLSHHEHWTRESLVTVLENLPLGTSEVMCHPGFVDGQLRKQSSLAEERLLEFRLFSDPSFRNLLRREEILLVPRL